MKGNGMFVHAIQGMRPNLVASAWNFAHFQSEELGGVSAIQMEFTTQEKHGKKGPGSGGVAVNIGSLVVGDKLVAITAETKWPGEESQGSVISRATHVKSEHDPETGYAQPTEIIFEWRGPSTVSDTPGTIEARLEADLGIPEKPRGLIEKIDVLAEIPYVLKLAVNYVAGTKPYIYQVSPGSCLWIYSFLNTSQWVNPGKLMVTGPDELYPGLSSGLGVSGVLYNEATFISQ